MKKYCLNGNKRSLAKAAAVLSLTACMALQMAGCSSSGVDADSSSAVASTKAPEDANDGNEGAAEKGSRAKDAAGGAVDVIGVSAANAAGDGAADMAGEGDSGIVAQPGAPLKAGNKAPDFTASLVDGSAITLSDYKGKPVIINFWATWCGPCVREMPAFERLKADFGDEIGIIAVNCGDDADTVKDFVDENGYTFPVALDESYEVTMLYPTNSIPYTVVVDANGKITHISAGAADADTMYERYKEALGL